MKKLWIVFICMLIAAPLAASQRQDSRITYFSPHSLYVYAMGSWYFNLPNDSYCGYDSGDDFNPTVGVGYTFVDFQRVFRINLEFDYTRNQAPVCGDILENQLDYWTFMFNLEYLFGRERAISLYAGTGVAWIYNRIPHYYSEDTSCFVISMGFKVPLVKKLNFRFDLRHYYDSDNSFDFVYLDDWGDIIIGLDGDYAYSYGSALSMGLEFHF